MKRCRQVQNKGTNTGTHLVHALHGLLAVGLRHVEDSVVALDHVQHVVVLQRDDAAAEADQGSARHKTQCDCAAVTEASRVYCLLI